MELESGISLRQYRRYTKGESVPDLESIAAFVVTLKLSYSDFEHLMKCAGIQFDNSPRSEFLRILLAVAPVSDLTVMKCNYILKRKGFKPLSESKDLNCTFLALKVCRLCTKENSDKIVRF